MHKKCAAAPITDKEMATWDTIDPRPRINEGVWADFRGIDSVDEFLSGPTPYTIPYFDSLVLSDVFALCDTEAWDEMDERLDAVGKSQIVSNLARQRRAESIKTARAVREMARAFTLEVEVGAMFNILERFDEETKRLGEEMQTLAFASLESVRMFCRSDLIAALKRIRSAPQTA